MQNTDTRWLSIRNLPEKDVSDFAFERRRLQQAEDLLTSDISNDLLLNLHLFAMDFEMENACYAVLKRQTEEALLERMASGKDQAHLHPDFVGSEQCSDRQAMEATISGSLEGKELLNLFLTAECTRFMDGDGRTWQAIFDLTRLQILRRMQGLRAGQPASDALQIPDDATILSATLPAKRVHPEHQGGT